MSPNEYLNRDENNRQSIEYDQYKRSKPNSGYNAQKAGHGQTVKT